jgi:hypothetical protein
MPSQTKLVLWELHNRHHHHHQPINAPTAGAPAFLMDYPQEERAITHHAGTVRIGLVLTTANAAGTNDFTCIPKHGEARNYKFLVTHPTTEQCCLASAIVRRAHWPWDHRAPGT